MNVRPLISVIVPMYNCQDFLEKSISSLLNQTYKNLEIIFIDDCSTDSTIEVLTNLISNDSRTRIISLEQNGGAGCARNIGIENANGDYISFFDCDDYIENDTFEKIAEVIITDQVDQIVFGVREVLVTNRGNIISQKAICPDKFISNDRRSLDIEFLKLEKQTLFGYPVNHVTKREYVESVRFKNYILYEDFFFNMEVHENITSLYVMDSCFYYYIKRESGSITGGFIKDYYKLSRERIETSYNYLAHQGIMDREVVNTLGNIYFRYILSSLVRFSDKRYEMNILERIKWIKYISNDKLYKDTCAICDCDRLVYRIMKLSIRSHLYFIVQIVGSLVVTVKKLMRNSYRKIIQRSR